MSRTDKLQLIQVVGARPQVIKSAALDRAVRKKFHDEIDLRTLHTGQHYDSPMSEVFYRELDISEPDIQLNIGSGGHADQTAAIMETCENRFSDSPPDGVVVYGDTNSTLAAALAAYHLDIPVIHIEAGLRSYDLRMPEECNRIATDHLSTFLFCPTLHAVDCLAKEGLNPHHGAVSLSRPGIFHVGDVMYDNNIYFQERGSDIESVQGIPIIADKFILATCHRPANVDNENTLTGILETLERLGSEIAPVILPVHPRVQQHDALLQRFKGSEHLILLEPVSYLEMSQLEKRTKMIITDSGGVQKESYFSKTPSLVLRDSTEWTELVEQGATVLCGNSPERIYEAAHQIDSTSVQYPALYGDGHAAELICKTLLEQMQC